MPIRRSGVYDDPLKQGSRSMEKITVPNKVTEHKSVAIQENQIEWSNLIFLPFHPVFELFVIYSVIIKVVLGPIQSVHPIVYCSDVMDHHPALIFIKYCYWYFCDSFYGIDTFLHIVHRQVTDKAMRREHLPKSAIFLIIDLVSLIPFFRIIAPACPAARLWPNILAFNEFLVVTQYFNLVTTNSYKNLIIGYSLVLCMTLNCITCFWLLLSKEGFCSRCTQIGNYFDWRASLVHKLNETNEEYATYVYAFSFVFSFTENGFFANEIKPSSVLEFAVICLFVNCSYILNHFIILPKFFAESLTRLRRVCGKYPITRKIIEDTKRRNTSVKAYKDVERYYLLLWRKRNGIVGMPVIFNTEIPRYLRLEISQDLFWPLYYHSPTLRKTSYPFRRWISEAVMTAYKLPGEKFFMGAHSASSFYYLKSGVVQLLSSDDGTTPVLSLTSGTVFGDINFYVPNYNRKVTSRCLTFCEFYFIPRKYFVQALHKYPDDRKIVMAAIESRLQHAKKLFDCKQMIRGLDRNEDEGITWIKRRWWEIWEVIEKWTRRTGKSREQIRCDLPREESVYHCAKYIGQLVLCSPTQLQTKSMFTNFTFPWILNPISKFGYVWHQIVYITVLLVVMFYPPNLIKYNIPSWFIFFTFYTDTIYALDIGVALFTAVKKNDMITNTFSTVMFERFKSFTFMLDLASTLWIEDLASVVGAPRQFYYTLQFNRLIKTYILFHGDYLKWDIKKDPLVDMCRKLVLINFTFLVLSSHIVFELICYIPDISVKYFFGEVLCSKTVRKNCSEPNPLTGVTVSWAFEWTFCEYIASNLSDIYVGIVVSFMSYLIFIYCKSSFVSYLYLQNREPTNYQRFVSNLKKYYEHYRIHQDLLKRLDRYLICHWKYYKGIDVMYSNGLEEEPYEVYWKAQGEVAEKVISESRAFSHADPALIRELACATKFLVLPKNTNLFMFGIQCKNVTWIVQGYVKSEYHDENGEMLTTYYGPGSMLSVSSVFFGKASLRSYTSYTDSETIYVPVHKFFDIYKRYSHEYDYLQNCINEFGSMFDDMFKKYILKHRDYQHKLRDKIYSTKMSMISTSKMIPDIQDRRSLPFEGDFWGEPESGFMQSWLMFRTIVVYISIASAAVLGGIGAVSRWIFTMVSAFCDCIAWIDIIIKLFLAYYDNRGLLITDKKKCFVNYATKALVLDVIGALPLYDILKSILSADIDDDTSFLINTVCKFAHLYILFAYFEYISDLPTVNSTLINIIKWQLVNSLLVLGSSHYFMVSCVKFEFNEKSMELLQVTLRNTCWMPDVITLPQNLSWDDLHLIFAESLSMAENGMMGLNFGRFNVNRNHIGVGLCLFFIGVIFWFISSYALTLLVLDARGDFLFQHAVNQLQRFLTSERVEKPIIEKVMRHFRYCWIRTKGIDVQKLTHESIGMVFRQDLNYYFFKKTFSILDTIIKGGEPMQRHLASVSTQAFFLPGHDICRENDLLTHLCVVHRGRVVISKENKKLILLTKGDIFGQLLGKKVRPVRITATAEDKVDLLYIEISAFQSIITDEVKRTIMRNPQQKSDFMATKNIFIENPYDTVQYLLRGRKIIRFPWCHYPTKAYRASWYSYFLHLTWFVGPFITILFVNSFAVLPTGHDMWLRVYVILIVCDVLHLANFISEFYTIELVVDKNYCVYRQVGVKKFKCWSLYLDLVSFIVPLGTLVQNDWRYQFARMLRLKYFYDFHNYFCRGFKRKFTPIVLKVAIMMLTVHSFTCGWIHIACRRGGKFPIPIKDMRSYNTTIDFTQWTHPDDRGEGCARMTGDIPVDDNPEVSMPSFVVPIYWPYDYVLAITYILLMHTRINLDTIMPLTLTEVYYKVFATFIMQLLDIYIMAMAINAAYTRYRELYQYNFAVKTMVTYLSDCGLSKSLSDTVLAYTAQLWRRHKGDKLPELAYQAPPCLRQDLFTALYVHHLEAPPTFRQLPQYFKRQLAARLKRRVIFPGKCIVREGDTFNTTYFIHEGEVEKWYNDQSGESKLLSVLYTNGYFGCISGLFVNVGFHFSYYTRTVVDLVYLELENWQDLLNSYPEVKTMLYDSTQALWKERTGNQ